MNRKYLEENNLMKAHKQFMRLCEWTYGLHDAGEDQQDPMVSGDDAMTGGDAMAAADPNAQGAAPTGDDMGTDPMAGGQDPMAGGDPNAMGGDMGDQDPNAMGEDPNAMAQDPMAGSDPMMGADPMAGGEDPMAGGEDNEVIDVEDITNAQEKMNKKVNTVGKEMGDVEDKIAQLMLALDKMQGMIDSNNEKIENFKYEFEKRNPTETEKLNLRSLDSYPFNVNPKDYWDSKNTDPNSNYSGYADNSEPTTQEYAITNSDVDDFDERQVEDSFSIPDDLRQTIEKIFDI